MKRGKPRLPTSGIRKPRAKDKRVGRKRYPRSNDDIPRDEMDATLMRAAWRDYDVHKVGGHFEWCGPETVFDRPVQERIPADFDPFSSPVIPGDFNGPHGDIADAVRTSVDPDDIPMRAGAASFVGMTPREIREQQAEADVIEDQIRSQAVVDRARAEHDEVPEAELQEWFDSVTDYHDRTPK